MQRGGNEIPLPVQAVLAATRCEGTLEVVRREGQLPVWHHQERAGVVAGDVCHSCMHPPPPGAGRISCRVLRQLLGSLMKELVFGRDGEQERVSYFSF